MFTNPIRRCPARSHFNLLLLILFMWPAFPSFADTLPRYQSGNMTLQSNDVNGQAALHVLTDADVQINGVLVNVTYWQIFKNQSDGPANGVYTFPLPDKAAVTHMTIRTGSRVIEGIIKPRQEARRLYRDAVVQGKRAALTEQQRPNLFTQQVSHIAQGETIEVTLQFLDIAEFRRGEFSWRLPTTLTPRYMPGMNMSSRESEAPATTGYEDLAALFPPFILPGSGKTNPLALTISLNGGMPLTSVYALYHDIDLTRQNDKFTITLKEGHSEMDRDFVLRWLPAPSAEPVAALFTEQSGDDYFSLLMVMPPAITQPQTLPRDITFVIDTSGSMQGQSIIQAKSGLITAIDKLKDTDLFNVIAFSDRFSLMFAEANIATPPARQAARQWVNQLQADGGTQMVPALTAAFAQNPRNERLHQVVFITDGAVGNEAELFSLISNFAGTSRLFTVGIGSAPNSYFMHKAAQAGRGTYEFIANPQDIAPQMNSLFAKLNHSAAKNIQPGWPEDAEVYPANTPDLYLNEPLLSFASTKTPVSSVTVSGETASQLWSQTLTSSDMPEGSGAGARWARQKIAHIEDEGRIGSLSEEKVKDQVTAVALQHSLLSRFTSFVAIDQSPVTYENSPRPPLRLRVANQLPQGMSHQQLQYPQTATTAELTLWLGILCIVAGLALLFWQRIKVR